MKHLRIAAFRPRQLVRYSLRSLPYRHHPLAFRDHIRQRPEAGGLIFEYGALERNRFVECGKSADDRDARRRSAIRACVDKSNFVVIVELRWIVYRVRAATICIDDGKAPGFGDPVPLRLFFWRPVGVPAVRVIPAEEFRAPIQDVLIVFLEEIFRCHCVNGSTLVSSI
jgi:hypothetical protein